MNLCTYINKIYEISIWAIHQSVEVFVSWHPYLATWIGSDHWVVVIIEENFSSWRLYENRSWRNTFNFHHECHVILLIFSWEKWVTNVEFIENTSKAPHINSRTIGNTEDNFGSPIESGLNVCINLLVLKAPTSKINDLDTWLVDLSKQNILRFQITMHYIVLIKEVEWYQYLNCESFYQV